MSRIVSVLLLSLMLVQAIPVLPLLSSGEDVYFTYIDEEKPDSGSKEKKDSKEWLFVSLHPHAHQLFCRVFPSAGEVFYASPSMDLLVPPPDQG